MKKTSYDVATKVLVAQAKTTLRDLNVDGTQQRRDALSGVGLNATDLRDQLQTLTEELAETEAMQERAKGAYLREAAEDQARAEAGYRYKLALDARVRAYLATYEDDQDLPGRFRFGKLRTARARSVTYELRIVLPEAEAMVSALSEVGIDAAFIERGRSLLAGLEADRDETAEMKDARKTATKQVRALELQVSQLLARLVAADEAVALEVPEEGSVFGLDIIRNEQARVAGARQARVLATPSPVVFEE